MAEILKYLVDTDTQIFLDINACHNAFWDVFMPLYSNKYVWAFFYLSLLYLLARNYTWKVTLLWLIATIVVITICDQVTASLIRPWVARLRPSNLQNPISDVVHVVNGYRGGNYSFPSAHAANSWGLAIFITMLFRNRWLSISMILWALLTCYSRMYLGVHYFGDLLIGMLIGCLGACIVYLLLTRFTDIKKPEKIEHTYVPIVALVATVVVFLGISAYQCLWP